MEEYYLLQINFISKSLMKNNNFIKMAKKNSIIFFFLAFFYISCSPGKPSSGIEDFYNYPNPFKPSESYTTYKVSIKSGEIINAKVDIYSKAGDLLDSKDLTNNNSDKKIAACLWSGLDKNGRYLPSGIYTAKITVKDNQDSTFIEEFQTSIR